MSLLTALRRCAAAVAAEDTPAAREAWKQAKQEADRAGVCPHRFLMTADWAIRAMVRRLEKDTAEAKRETT